MDCTDDDVCAAIHAIHWTCFEDQAPAVDFTVNYWWVALQDDLPVAFAGLSKKPNTPHTGYLMRSGVDPAHRGHKLQLRLIRARETHARRLGWHRLVTDTTSNPASANSLIAAGYRMYDPRDPWAFSDSLYWRKTL